VNLIGNAIEAMPEGGEVRISAEFGTDSVVVNVDDTGPGVVPEIRSQLFQPFVTAGKRNGLGLGLAFTRQAVLEQGGDLWASHAPIARSALPKARSVRMDILLLHGNRHGIRRYSIDTQTQWNCRPRSDRHGDEGVHLIEAHVAGGQAGKVGGCLDSADGHQRRLDCG